MSSGYYGSIAGEIADSGGNPMFGRMTDGEIAAYFRDRDREPEPDWSDYEEMRAIEEHEDEAHGGGPCTCPPPTPQEIEEQWAARQRQHLDEDHDGGPCDCQAPF